MKNISLSPSTYPVLLNELRHPIDPGLYGIGSSGTVVARAGATTRRVVPQQLVVSTSYLLRREAEVAVGGAGRGLARLKNGIRGDQNYERCTECEEGSPHLHVRWNTVRESEGTGLLTVNRNSLQGEPSSVAQASRMTLPCPRGQINPYLYLLLI